MIFTRMCDILVSVPLRRDEACIEKSRAFWKRGKKANTASPYFTGLQDRSERLFHSEFGRTHYENVAYFNFETNPKLNETFEENISPD